jgi:Spore coat polysaccharide biosynthesis protein, predicted glycosyltransferase
MPELWIFSEGDLPRGLGHITRCSSYASAWQEQGGKVHWVVDGDDTAKKLLHKQSVIWKSWQQELISTPHDAVAIVDSYSATSDVLKSISNHFVRVIYLDDTKRLSYPKGLVIHAAQSGNTSIADDAEWVFGAGWQPLRPAFWTVPPREQISEQIEQILILMGGTDIRKLTPTMLQLAHNIYPNAEIHTIISNPNTVTKQPKTIFHHQLNDKEIAELMCNCDIAISAAGQTTFELARCGLPSVLIGVADNQKEQLKKWTEDNLFMYGGWWNEPDLIAHVSSKLKALCGPDTRKQRAAALQRQIDGKGTMRAVKWLSQC